MKLCAGIDIGNAKTELAFEQNGELKLVRQPSVISYLPRTPEPNDLPVETIMENLMDNLTVNISSPAIRKNGDYFVGKKAMQHDGLKTNMLITVGGKATHDLPIITSLSLVAATALQQAYEESKQQKLPSNLSVDMDLVTAIPSSEFNRREAKILEDRFNGKHTVTLYVGDSHVSVLINITGCKVTEEGKTAMLAFLNSDSDILRVFNQMYNESKVPADFIEVRSLHTDIGDGTSELVVIEGANPVQGLSDGERLGVGHASDLAVKWLKEETSIPSGFTRQQLQEWLLKDNEKGELARRLMDEATYGQAQSILVVIEAAYQQLASSDVDYIFVHGGGSITFKEMLLEDLKAFADRNLFKIVWIPEEYATTMNSRGTFYLAKTMFK